jgi:transcriptional regulator with XRE-family HTH domain
MMTLRQFRLELGWNVSKLADAAGVTRQSVSAAERGGVIQAETAKAIADALSRAYQREIKPWEIEGLNIR